MKSVRAKFRLIIGLYVGSLMGAAVLVVLGLYQVAAVVVLGAFTVSGVGAVIHSRLTRITFHRSHALKKTLDQFVSEVSGADEAFHDDMNKMIKTLRFVEKDLAKNRESIKDLGKRLHALEEGQSRLEGLVQTSVALDRESADQKRADSDVAPGDVLIALTQRIEAMERRTLGVLESQRTAADERWGTFRDWLSSLKR